MSLLPLDSRDKVLHRSHKCYTQFMPTARHRHMITETDDLSVALDAAATLWPHAKNERAELLRLIINKGAQVVEQDVQALRDERLAAISQLAENFQDVWPNEWAQERAQEWPE